MAGGEEESRSIEFTATWIVAVVCSIIVIISLAAERGLHHLGKFLKGKGHHALFEALQKLKEELMLLGFISLLLTVSQGAISKICIPTHLANYMLPCKMEKPALSSSQHYSLLYTTNGGQRRLLASDVGAQHCARKGEVQMFSVEGIHQLHIFIFVLALVHVVFCATTMVLAGAKIREWKNWEDSIRHELSHGATDHVHRHHHHFFNERAIIGHYRKLPVVRWIRSFFKQFYGSVTKADYTALRLGFIKEHCPTLPKFDFHGYMLRTLEYDFKRIVGISWYLWLFVVIFLLMNISGWHTYFSLSFLPLILLLLVGTSLEHVITRLAKEVVERPADGQAPYVVKPSDEHFWFNSPKLVLYLIHFILFQNAFEIAFFIWIWTTYGFTSCVMEKIGYIIPRLVIGVIVQVLCSYSTLPLYAIVTQMGSMFKPGIFNEYIQSLVEDWAGSVRGGRARRRLSGVTSDHQMRRMEREPPLGRSYIDQQTSFDQETIESIIELSNRLESEELPSPRV